jgi:hypothetical protein
MKIVKSLIMAAALVAFGTSLVKSAEPDFWNDPFINFNKGAPTNQVQVEKLTSNMYLDVGGNVVRPNGQSANLGAAIGLNDGFTLAKFDNNAILGLQVGGSVGMVDTDPGNQSVYSSVVGIFTRGIPVEGKQLAAAGLLTYDHNERGANLFAFRPIIGLAIDKKNSIGGKAVVSLNEDAGEEAVDSGAGFWVRRWNTRVSSELTVGYKGGEIDEPYAGSTWAYSIDKNWDLAASYERDGNSDYAAFLKIVYGFGGKGIHSTINNIAGTDATPFPVSR